MAYIQGMAAKLYRGAAGALLAALLEVTNVRDVTVNMDASEMDVTTRANSGWRATGAGLRENTLEFEMVWNSDDAGFAAIRTAFLTGGLIELAALTGGKAISGSEGPKGSYSITSFSRSEPLEDAITVSVTAKLVTFGEWVDVA